MKNIKEIPQCEIMFKEVIGSLLIEHLLQENLLDDNEAIKNAIFLAYRWLVEGQDLKYTQADIGSIIEDAIVSAKSRESLKWHFEGEKVIFDHQKENNEINSLLASGQS